MSNFKIQVLPEIIVASHREVLKSYADLGSICCEKIGPEMARLGCKCSAGYCFTVEYGEHQTQNIDVEYCEQVDEIGTDSEFIKFKKLPAVPKAFCLRHVGPYERFNETFNEAFRLINEQGLAVCGQPRVSYIDGIWNQEDPEKWVSELQIPVM